MSPGLVRLSLVAVLVLVTGCGNGGTGEPAPVQFSAVDLRAGAEPVVLTAEGDRLLIGIRRPGQQTVPGLLRREPDGTTTEVAVSGTTPYALLARWRSIASDGKRIVALGGERGGAHGHVRWSVWSGSDQALTEQVQGFSVFGGYEAGDLVDVVMTPAGDALIGAWASAQQGFDVAVWTTDGADWARQSSAGTALESTPSALGFPMAAAAHEQGIVVAGWQVTIGGGTGGQQPVVWRSTSGNTGWTRTPLPDAGKAGSAVALRCWDTTCGVAGRVDGNLAVWRFAGGEWTRRSGLPPTAVGDRDRLVAPFEAGGHFYQPFSDGGQVKLARTDGAGWTVRQLAGPTGMVTSAAVVGDALYLLAGPDEDHQTLWRADLTALG